MSARGLLGMLIALALMGCGSKENPDLRRGEAGAGGRSGGGSASDGGPTAAGDDGGSVSDAGPGGHAGADGGLGSDTTDGGSETHDAGAPTTDAGADPRDAGTNDECGGRLLPLAVGNEWRYVVTHPVDGISVKTTTVTDESIVGGTGPNATKTAFHLVTEKVTGALADRTESWQGVLADGSVLRYRELGFAPGSTSPNGEEHWDPYKLRVDNSPAHTKKGASWHEQYTETKVAQGVTTPAARDDVWTVEGVGVPCGPVDGKMYSCLQLSKNKDGAATGKKTYWYAPCVGKVREEGAQTEELESFTLH